MANKTQRPNKENKKSKRGATPSTASLGRPQSEAVLRSKHSYKKAGKTYSGKTGQREGKGSHIVKPKVINLARSVEKARRTRERNKAFNVTKDGRPH